MDNNTTRLVGIGSGGEEKSFTESKPFSCLLLSVVSC